MEAGRPSLPESRGNFSSQDTGDALLRSRDCPEIREVSNGYGQVGGVYWRGCIGVSENRRRIDFLPAWVSIEGVLGATVRSRLV